MASPADTVGARGAAFNRAVNRFTPQRNQIADQARETNRVDTEAVDTSDQSAPTQETEQTREGPQARADQERSIQSRLVLSNDPNGIQRENLNNLSDRINQLRGQEAFQQNTAEQLDRPNGSTQASGRILDQRI